MTSNLGASELTGRTDPVIGAATAATGDSAMVVPTLQCRVRLRRRGVYSRLPVVLSGRNDAGVDHEHEAGGQSNNGVATRLYITERTVVAHLAQTFAKW